MAKFELIIENEGILSFVELREIVAILDDHISQDLRYAHWRRYGPFPPFFFEDDWPSDQRDFSFVVNDRLEDWSEANQRLRDRKTKVTLKRFEPGPD